MNDRQEVYESRQVRDVNHVVPLVENDRAVAAKAIAENAKLLVDAFMEVGFSMDAAIMLCGRVLPELL